MYVCVLVAAVLLSAQLATASNRELEPLVAFQPNMAKLLMSSRLTVEDPAKAMKCFSDYISQSNQISQQYSNDYRRCLVQSQAERSEFEDSMLVHRMEIANLTTEVCYRMNKCNKMNTTMESFQCHAENGAENSRDVYVVAGNASEYVTIMREHYRIFDLRHEKCCKLAERIYVKSSAGNYRELHDCLDCKGNGVLTLPNPDNSTTATTTTGILLEEAVETETTVAPTEHSVEVDAPEALKLSVHTNLTAQLGLLLNHMN